MSDALIDTLPVLKSNLGMTETESKVYIPIALGGNMTAGSVAAVIGETLSKVKRALNSLLKKGLVVQVEGLVPLYRAISPNMTVNKALTAVHEDFETFKNYGEKREFIFGGLYHKTLKTKRSKDIEKITENLPYKLLMLNRDISSPSPKELTDFYNKIKVWMAPTELEGLHNPPMEASLCGCALVATDHERSGMSDYAIHEETALVYPAGDLEKAGNYIKILMDFDTIRKKYNDNMVQLLTHVIGSRKDNMKRLLEIIG